MVLRFMLCFDHCPFSISMQTLVPSRKIHENLNVPLGSHYQRPSDHVQGPSLKAPAGLTASQLTLLPEQEGNRNLCGGDEWGCLGYVV